MKKSYLILIIAVVLAGLVYFVERPDKERISDFKPFKLYPALTGVTKIEVEHLMSGSSITKDGDKWYVAEMPTMLSRQMEGQEADSVVISDKKYLSDTEKIDRAIELVGKIEAKEHISNNPEKQAIYQVNNIGERVRMYDAAGKIVADFYIGKTGPDMFSNYIRKEGENDVYLTSEIAGALPADVMSWRDLKIWTFDPAVIGEVNFAGQKLVKDEKGEWSENDKKFIEKITPLSATRFAMVTSPADTGFDKPQLEVVIKTSDGNEKKLIFGKIDPQGYVYAKLENGEDIYLMSSDTLKKFTDFGKEE